jgi:hypothetical protein
MSGADELKWARRVPQELIRRLYTLDAKGIRDEELVDEVGYAMYARCESMRTVTEAHAGRPRCPRCSEQLAHRWVKDEAMVCACGWSATWGEYLRSYQGKQLHGGTGYPNVLTFLDAWPNARAYPEKLLAIDTLIHACHGPGTQWLMARPLGVNLIEGNAHEIAALLDELAYGTKSTPGLVETRDAWRAKAEVSGWRPGRPGWRKHER